MVERHGEVWMVLFQLQADQGVSGAVQGSLAGLVHWDVTVLDDVNHLEEHVVGDGSEGVMVALPEGLLAATVPEESSTNVGEGLERATSDGKTNLETEENL